MDPHQPSIFPAPSPRRTRAYLFVFILLTMQAHVVFGSQVNKRLPICGSMYAPPFANPADAGPRPCSKSGTRQYVRRHTGLGYEILDLESKVCFVADDSYHLLDDIVDNAKASLNSYLASPTPMTRDVVLHVSKTISDVLAAHNFGLYIPTETLGDSLAFRNMPSEPERHIVDCDTGSLIYMTVAENLSLPLYLVDITLPSDAGHNYVRWQLANGATVDWDTNGRAECVTPENIASFEGKSMSREQVMGYVYGILADLDKRAHDYKQAIVDYRTSITLYPESPQSPNNFAWMIATTEFTERSTLKNEALIQAKRAVKAQRNANRLDTLSCVFALVGEFASAVATETEAVKLNPKEEFQKRLERLKVRRDCTGLD